ncbi:hypothetical protein Q4512_05040 [Oceanihabitans sp. 2_MG-2023]|uniref:hypothetical protein n=1 Tax=Oceanihabitans sp. 2_MG-2023 TaxID=3062661 RepID=UPI0026E2C069|nr:hypothetical protein [Oceanihabitans sp. 2_MG-2023]MDO6596270.1 hypothetical protein [Oceanihabitans sp. 2_MG-2023]
MATKIKATIINTTANKVLGLTTKANDFALNTTEKVFTKSIDLTEKGVGLSAKLVKKGLKFSAKNQDVIFNTLETVKGKAVQFLAKSK